jgi:hypothetical protein
VDEHDPLGGALITNYGLRLHGRFFFSEIRMKTARKESQSLLNMFKPGLAKSVPFFFQLFIAPESAQLADVIAATFCNVLLAGSL